MKCSFKFLQFSAILFLLFGLPNILTANVSPGTISGGLKDDLEHSIPDWFKDSFLDIEDDVAQANENKKHLMLFFYLNDCPYCYKMLQDSFATSTQKQYIQDNFDVIAINTKGAREIAFNQQLTVAEKQLAQKLKVQYTPAILFLNKDNQTVVRLNGYRSDKKFRNIMDYVSSRAYEVISLSDYLKRLKRDKSYVLRKIPQFSEIRDLSKINGPLAVIFEDQECGGCMHLHDNLLKNREVLKELKNFTVVRLNADSEQTIIDLNGHTTTPGQWAKKAAITYRPGILLYHNKREITRIDGMLYSFHFKEVFRYVSSNAYQRYDTYLEYLAIRQQELIGKGIDIDITR